MYIQYARILTIHTDTIIYILSKNLMHLIRTYTCIYIHVLTNTTENVYARSSANPKIYTCHYLFDVNFCAWSVLVCI